MEPAEEGEGFLGFLNEIDGSGGDFLKMPAGGSRIPASAESVAQRLHYVKQGGQQVFKYAVTKMYEICRNLLEKHGLTTDDVKLLIPHQANRRIITATAERLGLRDDQVIINIDRYGNTVAATVPLATRDAIECGSEERRLSDFRRGRSGIHCRSEFVALALLGIVGQTIGFQWSVFGSANGRRRTPIACSGRECRQDDVAGNHCR